MFGHTVRTHMHIYACARIRLISKVFAEGSGVEIHGGCFVPRSQQNTRLSVRYITVATYALSQPVQLYIGTSEKSSGTRLSLSADAAVSICRRQAIQDPPLSLCADPHGTICRLRCSLLCALRCAARYLKATRRKTLLSCRQNTRYR